MEMSIRVIEGGRQVFTPEGKLLLTILLHDGPRVRIMIVSANGDIRFRGVVSKSKVEAHIAKAIELELAIEIRSQLVVTEKSS